VDSFVAPGRKKKRPNFSPEFRKAMAQQACEPGVSVSQLAKENDINVNMLFKWRRHLMAGLFDTPVHPQVMLPVTLVETSARAIEEIKMKRPAAPAADASADAVRQRVIEIQIAGATIRFDGHADLATLGAVLRMLRP
jgi:transposase